MSNWAGWGIWFSREGRGHGRDGVTVEVGHVCVLMSTRPGGRRRFRRIQHRHLSTATRRRKARGKAAPSECTSFLDGCSVNGVGRRLTAQFNLVCLLARDFLPSRQGPIRS